MRKAMLVISVLAATAAAVAIAIPASGEQTAAEKPSPSVGTNCLIFPSPGTDVAAGAPSLDDQRMWHQDISQAPIDPNSDAIIQATPGGQLHPDFGRPSKYGIPYVVVGNSTKLVKVKWTAYGSESTKGKYRIPLSAPVEGGKNADGDRHVIAVDVDNCKLYELFNAVPDKKHNRWKADGGVIWDLTSAGLRPDGLTSADAAGLPIFPGLVRYEEVASGSINHAIRLTFAKTRDAFIHPASHCAGSTGNANVVAMGQRMRLKAGYDISNLTGQALIIAEAMKKYGVVVADNGSDWFFSGTSDSRWNTDELNELKEIPASAFEVVATQAQSQSC